MCYGVSVVSILDKINHVIMRLYHMSEFDTYSHDVTSLLCGMNHLSLWVVLQTYHAWDQCFCANTLSHVTTVHSIYVVLCFRNMYSSVAFCYVVQCFGEIRRILLRCMFLMIRNAFEKWLMFWVMRYAFEKRCMFLMIRWAYKKIIYVSAN